MKITYHIPTEQYGFVEIEETEEDLTLDELIRSYEEVKALVVPQNATGEGLEPKVWNSAVCEYLETGELKNGTELYQQMSPEQQNWFQVTKRAFKRLKSKE